MKDINKNSLDKKIEKFCESSAELLTGIHTRHNGKGQGTSKRKRKRMQEEIISIPDLDIDFHSEDTFEDLA